MATVSALLLANAQQQFLDQNGTPMAGGFVYTYVPGTTTPQVTWTDPGLSVPNTNPILLDMAGRCQIWIAPGTFLRQIVTDGNGAAIWDQITGFQDTLSEVPGNLTVDGTLTAGAVVSTTSVTAAGAITAGSNLTVGGTANVVGDINADAVTTNAGIAIGGSLTVGGNVNITGGTAVAGFSASGVADFSGNVEFLADVGFNGTSPITKPTVTGSRSGNVALAGLLTAMALYGLITDGTTP